MTMLRPYPEYKPSGIDWLGEVPANWQVCRLKHAAAISPSKSESPMVNATESVPFVPMERLGVDGSVDGSYRRLHQEVRNGFTYFREQDVLLAKITPCFENGKAGVVSQLDGGFGYGSTEYHVLRVRGSLTPQHLYRIVSSQWFRTIGQDFMEGSAGQKRVPTDFVANFPIPLPPLEEQRAIADFLDAMDAKFTRFIAARRRMIALLEEQKQAIINQAVTRGLDPDIPLKPSGIDWLGDIPAHWKTVPLGRLVSIAGGMTPNKSNAGYWTGTIPWISPKDMKTSRITGAVDYISEQAVRETGLAIVPLRSILIVVRGMILARKVPVAVTDIPLTINQDMKALIPKPVIGSEYLARLLEAAQNALFPLIDESGHGTRRLPTPALLGLQLPVPSNGEQARIVAHIDDTVSKISGTVKRHLREIQLIQEYRTRLISDIVTGKLDVRGVELPAIDEISTLAGEHSREVRV